ncbi:phage portal protein family protein [Nostoc sp.]|uniref:phage portal protein family protein n=1 Tax=Nostoc sp. TaxID=1180 RepID=UPI002FF70133
MPLSAKLTDEIASAQSDPRYYLFNGFGNITTPDDTLLYQLAGDADQYDLILKDAHAKAVLEARDRNVVCREWKVKPASESKIDKKAADIVTDVLEGMTYNPSLAGSDDLGFDFDQFCSDLNSYPLLRGNGFLELKWNIDGKTTYIEDVTPKPNHRFRFALPQDKKSNSIGYYRGYEIRILSQGDMFTGDTVPPRRILCHSYGRRNDNPWGIGLGRVLYWLAVVFKKELIKQRLIYLDKYAQPTLLGKAGEKATEAQRQEFTNLLAKILRGGYGTLPQGWEAAFLEAQRSSTTDVYQMAIDWCNSEMSKLVLGETLSLELPANTGSRAAAQTHQDGSTIYLAKFDSDRISTGPLRQLSRWITFLNEPDAKPPMIWRNFPELEESEDLNARVNRDNTLNTIGYKIKPDAVKEVYGDIYEDAASTAAEQEKQRADSGAFDVGFDEGRRKKFGGRRDDSSLLPSSPELLPSYEERKAIAFKKRLEKAGINHGFVRNITRSYAKAR